MKTTKRGYKKPEQHDQLEHSVHDISYTFDLIEKDIDSVEKNLDGAADNGSELLWQNIKNASELSLIKGVTKNGR